MPNSRKACSNSSVVMNLQQLHILTRLVISYQLKFKFKVGRNVYLPAVIFIEVLEGRVEVLFSVHSVHVHCRRDELVIVYRPIAISVSLI